MKNKVFLFVFILFGFNETIISQHIFRSGVLLHHSTGARIYDYDTYMGVNECSTSVPNEINAYNTENGFTGENAVSMTEDWFPSEISGLGNDWYNWHWIFDNLEPTADIYPFIHYNKIIVIKSCSPATDMIGEGNPEDTIGAGASYKTVYNYKWHLRSIVQIMESYTENFFVIWTQAPQTPDNTNSTESGYAHRFSAWLKDTLATGLDTVYGAFPPNVYIFDFFHLLADSTAGYAMNEDYYSAPDDDHPNAAAADVIAPLLVQEIFDAAIVYEGAFPVELTSFSASVRGSTIKLDWITETEVNNYGFEIHRFTENDKSGWIKIGFVQGNGNSNSPKYYSFKDENLAAGKYSYRLKQIDTDGQFEYSKVIQVEVGSPMKCELSQNYPNPFNPSTTIHFSLAEGGNVKLTIYNTLGQEVKSIVNEFRESGTHTINFDAEGLNSGIYIYKLEANGFFQTRKMALIK